MWCAGLVADRALSLFTPVSDRAELAAPCSCFAMFTTPKPGSGITPDMVASTGSRISGDALFGGSGVPKMSVSLQPRTATSTKMWEQDLQDLLVLQGLSHILLGPKPTKVMLATAMPELREADLDGHLAATLKEWATENSKLYFIAKSGVRMSLYRMAQGAWYYRGDNALT